MVVRAAAVAVLLASSAAAQTPSRAQVHQLAKLPQSRYFVIPASGATAPKAGRPLLVVLPGGDGSAEFLPFVENGIAGQLADDCVVAMVVAPRWRKDQQIVWPTAKSKTPGMGYSTEDYVRAVIADISAAQAIDRGRVHLLAWSSGGPAAYALLLQEPKTFRGAYVAMSIWRPADKAELARTKGLRIVLDQSPQDAVTKFAFCRQAYDALHGAGAEVAVSIYQGGHGWNDDPLARLRTNFGWLFGDAAAPAPQWPGESSVQAPDGELLQNGDFEQGTDGWKVQQNSGRLHVDTSTDCKVGKQSLHLQKDGGAPLDIVLQSVTSMPADGKLTFSAWVKSKGTRNAFVKCFFYGDGDAVLSEAVDVAHVAADQDWQQVTKTWDVAGCKRAVVQIVMVQGGELWVDGSSLRAAK